MADISSHFQEAIEFIGEEKDTQSLLDSFVYFCGFRVHSFNALQDSILQACSLQFSLFLQLLCYYKATSLKSYKYPAEKERHLFIGVFIFEKQLQIGPLLSEPAAIQK